MRVDGYEVVRELGGGAMGVVYLAREVELNRPVALKRLRETSPRALARFALEAKAAARLQHPNIVKLHHAHLEGPAPYLVMSYVEGETLEARVRERGRLEPEEAVAITLQLADALTHAHQEGVLHRDVKPANVLIGVDGRAYLTDFGLAKRSDESLEALTRTGQIVGTPAFMAPEQARGERADLGPWTDVYGLGATLYALLAGRAPHERSNMMALVAAVAHEDPPALRDLVPSLDRALAETVHHCLQKRHQDRFATCEALAASLRAGAAPPNPLRRRRRVRLLAAALLLGGAGGLGGWAASGSVAQPEERPSPTRPAPRSPTEAGPAVVDPRWERARFRIDDDPGRAWELVAAAEGEPSPAVADQLARIARRHCQQLAPKLLRVSSPTRRSQFLACARTLGRLRRPLAPFVSGLNPTVGFERSASSNQLFVRELLGALRGNEPLGFARWVMAFVSSLGASSRRAWLPECKRLVDTSVFEPAAQVALISLAESTIAGLAPASTLEERSILKDSVRRIRRLSALRPNLALVTRSLALAQVRLGAWPEALESSRRGWVSSRDVECLGISALANDRLGQKQIAVRDALAYLKASAASARGPAPEFAVYAILAGPIWKAIYLQVLGLVWDARHPAAESAILAATRRYPRLHGWELRLVVASTRRGDLEVAARRLADLRGRVPGEGEARYCTCPAEAHALILSVPAPAAAQLEEVVGDLDVQRRRLQGGLP